MGVIVNTINNFDIESNILDFKDVKNIIMISSNISNSFKKDIILQSCQ